MPNEQIENPFSYISMNFNAIIAGLKYGTLQETLRTLESAARRNIELSCYQLTTDKFPCRGICQGCVFGGSMSGKIKKIKEMIEENERRKNKPRDTLPID